MRLDVWNSADDEDDCRSIVEEIPDEREEDSAEQFSPRVVIELGLTSREQRSIRDERVDHNARRTETSGIIIIMVDCQSIVHLGRIFTMVYVFLVCDENSPMLLKDAKENERDLPNLWQSRWTLGAASIDFRDTNHICRDVDITTSHQDHEDSLSILLGDLPCGIPIPLHHRHYYCTVQSLIAWSGRRRNHSDLRISSLLQSSDGTRHYFAH